MYNLSFLKHHFNNDPFIYYCHLNDKPKDEECNFIKYITEDKKILQNKIKSYLKENYKVFDCEDSNINLKSIIKNNTDYDILWKPYISDTNYYFNDFFIAKKCLFFEEKEKEYICVILNTNTSLDKNLFECYSKFIYKFVGDLISRTFYSTKIQESFFVSSNWGKYIVKENMDILDIYFQNTIKQIENTKKMIVGKTIFPNMKNTDDYPYHSYKKEIAREIDEITQYYYCTEKHRNCYNKTSRHKPYNLKTLGITNKESARNKTIKKFLQNKGHADLDKIQDVLYRKLNDKQVLFYLDIEQIPNIIRDYSQFPLISSNSMIYNIGIIYHDTISNEIEFRSFFTNNLSQESEYSLILDLHSYINSKTENKEYSIIHWGKAEVNFLKTVENKNHNDMFDYSLFFDLCGFFIENDIIFKNMKNFKLKEVAKSIDNFKKENNIQRTIHYYKNEYYIQKNNYSQTKLLNVLDGMETIGMFLTDKNSTILHESIMYYNEKDCEYLYNIINYLFFSRL